MSRARTLGVVLIVVGSLFISSGYRAQPHRTVAIVAGFLFVVAGLIRLFGARRS